MKSKSKFGAALAAAGLSLCILPATHAAGIDAAASEGGSGLNLKIEPAHRKFMRFSYIYIKPNTKTSPTKDVTGPLITAADAAEMNSQCNFVSCSAKYSAPGITPMNVYLFGNGLNTAIGQDGNPALLNTDSGQAVGVGLPSGITADAKGAGSLAISAGAFLDPEEKWSTELYVFALPFNNVVEGGGSVTEINNSDGSIIRVRQNYLAGKSIIKTKQLPPTAVFSYYFGDKRSAFRPFLGLGVTYAMFFNTRATPTLEDYSGGPTEVKLKNAFGAGPFAGLQYRLTDRMHLSAQFGYVKLKTTATMTTRTDAARLANSQVLQDFSGYVGAVNRGIFTTMPQVPLDGLLALQYSRGGSLGTYVRKQDTKLDPYIMTLSVGYDF